MKVLKLPLLLLFIAVPMIEIALFIQVGGIIGVWPTIAIVLLTALVGTSMLKQQGRGTLNDLQSRIQRGEDPTGPIAHGAMLLVSGVLLLTPGFFTDAVGLLLLFPPFRDMVMKRMAKRMAANVHVSGFGAGMHGQTGAGSNRRNPYDDGVVDGEFTEVNPDEFGGKPNDKSPWNEGDDKRLH